MEIDIRALKSVTNAILDHIVNDLKIDKLTVPDNKDFYWNVPTDQLYEVKASQPELDVGRLSDDWEFLESILKDKSHAVSLMMMHVAPLLRHVGEEIGQ
jgi:hypothetical protein